MLKLLLVLVILCITGCIYTSNSTWRTDRRPKVMGDRLSILSISTRQRRVQQYITMWHNSFRSRVEPKAANMLLMKWHKGAAKTARRWANQCMVLTHDNVTGRSVHGFGACGQNIFVATQKVPWRFAIETWYLEKNDFKYGKQGNELKLVGHYTQMVWATTHLVGCGFNECHRFGNKSMRTYFIYVCNYCPIGNRPKRLSRPYIKGEPCKSCPNYCHGKKFCTNSCPVADQWANCRQLKRRFSNWLCNTHNTISGKERFDNCKATCTCRGQLHD